jgi:4-hydroxyphenylpyruvate dioxygenase
VGYRGPETGVRDRASYLLEQDKIRSRPHLPDGHPEGEIARTILTHGDGVRDLAFWVDDCRHAYAYAVERGARWSVQEPTVLKDEHGEVVIAAIRTYGDTIHSSSSAATTAGSSCRASGR